MPNSEWKEEFIGESWYLGDTYISSIGQGNILMTPLQVNQVTSVVADQGGWCRPHLVKMEEKCRNLDITELSLDPLYNDEVTTLTTANNQLIGMANQRHSRHFPGYRGNKTCLGCV